MSLRTIFFSVLIFLSSSLATPATLATETILSYKIFSPEKNVLDLLTDRAEIIRKEGDDFILYVTKENNNWFQKLLTEKKLESSLLSNDVNLELKNASLVSGYKNSTEVNAVVDNWLKAYPGVLSKVEYGISANKKPLLVYVFKPVGTESLPAPKKVLVTAATHGDELITVEVLLKQMEFIFSNIATNTRLQSALKDKWLYFIPVVSPDSYDRRERYVEGKDPNRAYPWPENTNSRQRVSVIESLMSFTDKEKFSATLDLHAYGQMVMFPWGYTTKAPDAQDVPVFETVVAEMSRENNYKHGQISTTIYVARGSSADYYYWKNKTKALAVEIGKEKIPRIEKLPAILKETEEMFYRFYEGI